MAPHALQCVDLIRADGTPLDGLVPIRPPGKATSPLSIDEQAAVYDAESFNRVDFVLLPAVFGRKVLPDCCVRRRQFG